jgi:hypothetical protein
MKREYMGNQRGEIVTGVMVVMMTGMMLFGGMHMMHGHQGNSDEHDRMESKHDHQKEGTHHMQNDKVGGSSAPDGETRDQK